MRKRRKSTGEKKKYNAMRPGGKSGAGVLGKRNTHSCKGNNTKRTGGNSGTGVSGDGSK